MDEELIIREYGNASGLIESIRSETDRKIDEIKKQTRYETAKLEKEYGDEMHGFRDSRKQETDRAIGKAAYILKNRAVIEKRKLQLNAVEDFMQRTLEEAVSDVVMNRPKEYISFLKKKITGALSNAPGNDILIHLAPGDTGLDKELRDTITQKCLFQGDIAFMTDDAITSGGVILENRSEGISYNLTMERIISRGYDTIRKEAVKIVQKYIKPAG